jgi:hypothetical protein
MVSSCRNDHGPLHRQRSLLRQLRWQRPRLQILTASPFEAWIARLPSAEGAGSSESVRVVTMRRLTIFILRLTASDQVTIELDVKAARSCEVEILAIERAHLGIQQLEGVAS